MHKPESTLLATRQAGATALLVLGMHRSGTSAMSGALALAGITLGSRLLPAGADNRKGYWENEQAVEINERLLTGLDRSWDDVRALPENWLQDDAVAEARVRIAELVRTEFSDAPVWALKDPRLCRLLPAWLPVLHSQDVTPISIFVVRAPEEVAASLQARNGLPPRLGRLLWLRHVFEAEAATRGMPRTAVTYDDLLSAPGAVIEALADKLGFPIKVDEGELARFIDGSERHHQGDEKAVADEPCAALVARVYSALKTIAGGESSWDEIADAASSFDVEWLPQPALLDDLAAVLAQARQELGSREVAMATLRSELRAQVDWSNVAVHAREALQAENARLQSDLSAQLRWSEEAVQARDHLQAENARLQSDLSAQLQWSEAAVQVRDRLQAENARLQSDLSAQLRWSGEAVQVRDHLQAENARLQSDLSAQLRWSEEAVQVRDHLQAENARLQAALNAQVRWSEEAVAVREALQAEIAQLRSEYAAQIRWSEEAVAAWQQREKQHLETSIAGERLSEDLAAMRASVSWRLTRPLRVLAGAFQARKTGG